MHADKPRAPQQNRSRPLLRLDSVPEEVDRDGLTDRNRLDAEPTHESFFHRRNRRERLGWNMRSTTQCEAPKQEGQHNHAQEGQERGHVRHPATSLSGDG